MKTGKRYRPYSFLLTFFSFSFSNFGYRVGGIPALLRVVLRTGIFDGGGLIGENSSLTGRDFNEAGAFIWSGLDVGCEGMTETCVSSD